MVDVSISVLFSMQNRRSRHENYQRWFTNSLEIKSQCMISLVIFLSCSRFILFKCFGKTTSVFTSSKTMHMFW